MITKAQKTIFAPLQLQGGYTFAQNPLFTRISIIILYQTQGDSILLKSPQGKFILVDGGGSQFFDPGSDKVLPYLHRRGIRELYMIINSHPDFDHLQGLEKVAGEMPVQYIAIPACLAEAKEYDLLKKLARKRSAVLLKLAEGQEIGIEKDWLLKVLYPDRKANTAFFICSEELRLTCTDWSY